MMSEAMHQIIEDLKNDGGDGDNDDSADENESVTATEDEQSP